jgi:hypothetical protein
MYSIKFFNGGAFFGGLMCGLLDLSAPKMHNMMIAMFIWAVVNLVGFIIISCLERMRKGISS